MTIVELVEAIEEGKIKKVKSILKSEPSLIDESTETGYTPIHSAVHHEQVKILQFLIEAGADVNALDGRQETPLHFAAQDGLFDIARLLITHGADVNAKGAKVAGSRTPIYLAATKYGHDFYDDNIDHAKVVDLLIGAGAEVDANSAVLMGDNERLRTLIAENRSLSVIALNRHELLENAAKARNEEAAQILLEYGLKPTPEALITAMGISENENDDPSSLNMLRMYLEASAGEFLFTTVPGNPRTTIYERAKEMAAKTSRVKPPTGFMELIEQYNPGS